MLLEAKTTEACSAVKDLLLDEASEGHFETENEEPDKSLS